MSTTSFPDLSPADRGAAAITAWQDAMTRFARVIDESDPSDWDRPTDCPGWSVGDIVAHIIGIERLLGGEPDVPEELDWDQLPHVRNDFGRFTELSVAVRRDRSRDVVVAELHAWIEIRRQQLADGSQDADLPVVGPRGPTTFGDMLSMRTFDAWVHVQDVRRALGLPSGDLDGPGAQVAAARMARAMSYAFGKNLKAPARSTLRIEVTGPIAFSTGATIDDAGRGVEVDPEQLGEPTVGLSTDWETFAMLCCGRVDPASVADRLTLTGPADLAERLPAAISIAP